MSAYYLSPVYGPKSIVDQINDACAAGVAIVCPVCDTVNNNDDQQCVECGHFPKAAPGEDGCEACRLLGK
jgi:hypothetical protein